MTSAQLVDLKGKKVGEVALDESVFGVDVKSDVMFNALIRQLANARVGTASTKTRSEVSGGGRKPWRQKGTGRARAGSIRSPLWAGGGVIFGPKPRDYTMSMPKKMRQAAVKSALAARKDDLVVVKDFQDIKEAKTKHVAAALKTLGLAGKKVLLVLDFSCDHCSLVERAARNIEGLKVIHSNNLNVKDLLEFDSILTNEKTVETISKRFKGETAQEKKAKKSARASKADTPAAAKPAKARASEPKAEKAKAEPKAPKKAAKAEEAKPEEAKKPRAKKEKTEE